MRLFTDVETGIEFVVSQVEACGTNRASDVCRGIHFEDISPLQAQGYLFTLKGRGVTGTGSAPFHLESARLFD